MKIITLFLTLAMPFQTDYRVPPGTRVGWQIVSGNDLFEKCRIKGSVACGEYIAGVVDTVGFLETEKRPPDDHSAWQFSFICMPTDANTVQTRDLVVKYMEDHPETRAMPAPILVVGAMLNAWRCPSK